MAPARSTSKGKPPANAYPDDVRETALTLMREESLAAAHDSTGVPKSTLSRWAKAAGIDLGGQAKERTAAATEVVRERGARARADTVKILEDHIGEAGSYLAEIVEANAAAADLISALDPSKIEIVEGEFGTSILIDDTPTKSAVKLTKALAGLPLSVRDAEGILTRAIHDLQLLRGEATERGEVSVQFAVPRPNTSRPPVPEAELAGASA